MREFRLIFTLTATALVLIAAFPLVARTASEMVNGPTKFAAPTSAPAPAAQPAEQSTDWSTTMAIGVIVLVVCVVIGMLIAFAWWFSSKRRTERHAHQAGRAARVELWHQGLQALAATSEAMWDFESDPESVYFTRRLLADVDEPATAAFYTAYATAQSLCTDTIPDDSTMVIAFVDATAAARRAFGIADENARRKARLGISHNEHTLTRDQRRKIDQAQKLMRQARDPAATEQNAHNALAKALSLLDAAGAIIPERLTANITKSIETIHRRALTQ